MDADATLRTLAQAHGIGTEWRDAWGHLRQVEFDVLRALLAALGIDAGTPAQADQALAEATAHRLTAMPPLLTAEAGAMLSLELALPTEQLVRWTILAGDGSRHDGRAVTEQFGDGRIGARVAVPAVPGYGRLALEDGALGEAELAIAPAACPPMPERPGWGLGVQVYGLPGDGPGDIGHCGSLIRLCAAAAQAGADAVAVSPMHALFTADAGHYSPYAPSTRRFRNGLLAAPTLALDGCGDGAAGDALLHYEQAAPARLDALRRLFAAFRRDHLATGDNLAGEFEAFRARGGTALADHACFEALHARHFAADPHQWDWHCWPSTLQAADSDAVRAFAARHSDEISFHTFLQWLVDRQLDAAQRGARGGGMAIGLISDLAVGTHPAGSRAWSEGGALLRGVTIGAPPDMIAQQGQDWGLATFSPTGLAASGFAPYRADLQAAMRHAGGVRLDHIMGLARVWCIPAGASARQGAYMRMPWTDLARLTALEAHRHGCVVIGEDLGTVPEGFRDELARRRLYGMSVLWFTRGDGGRFLQPPEYPACAVAMTSTHDLPTVCGWWCGHDIDWRERLGLFRAGEVATARAERLADRAALWDALLRVGTVADPAIPEALDADAVAAITGFLARTPAPLLILPIEDLVMQPEQPNLPGTTTEHPNWRRRLARDLAGLFDRPPAATILRSLGMRRRPA